VVNCAEKHLHRYVEFRYNNPSRSAAMMGSGALPHSRASSASGSPIKQLTAKPELARGRQLLFQFMRPKRRLAR
jgi:hypothetical protein